MQLRRTICVSLALSACLGFAGCGGDDDSSAGGDATLRIVGTSDTEAAATAVIDAYKAAHPDVDVKVTFTPTDQYTTTTRTQLSGSNGADVLLAFSGGGNTMSALALGREGALMDLSGEKWASRVPDTAKKEVSVDGELYDFPSGFDTIGAIYDTALWADHGIQVPTTWTDLLASCDAWNKEGITPMSVGMATEFVPQFISYTLVPSTVYSQDPEFDAEQAAGDATFASSGWAEAFDKYVELQKADCFGKDFTGLTYEQMLAQVANNEAAMAITVAPSFPAIREANPNGSFAMFPVPAYDDTSRNYIPTGLSVGWAVNAHTDVADLAKEFVAFANEPANLNAFAEKLGVVSLDPGGVVPEGLEAMQALSVAGKVGPFPDHLWPSAKVQETHNSVVQEIFTGQTSVADALKKMDDAYAQASK